MENDLPPPTPPPLPPPILPAKKSKAGRGWKIATLLLAVCLAVSLFSNVAHFFFNLVFNSAGAEVLASDDIYRAIVKFQNEQKKPVIASMGSLAASGGYYVSAACRWIVANELTLTGSIGVIMHAYNVSGLMDKIGVRAETYKSGIHKDMLSPFR